MHINLNVGFFFLSMDIHLKEYDLMILWVSLRLWLLTFGCLLSLDCKLARGGPPATIVAIDEESRNGEWALCFTNDLSKKDFF